MHRLIGGITLALGLGTLKARAAAGRSSDGMDCPRSRRTTLADARRFAGAWSDWSTVSRAPGRQSHEPKRPMYQRFMSCVSDR